ncbi:amidohydrolase [Peptococcaceae bacterium 1198_IL3148]
MLAINGGKVHTGTGTVIDKATVLIDNNKIVAVGKGIAIPDGCQVIDVTDKIVTPGFIDAHCHVGIYEEGCQNAGDDANETTDPVTPHLRALDGINPEDQGFKDALAGGVTSVVVAPGSANILGGEMVALKTHGHVVDQMVIKGPVGMKAALGENPKRIYGGEKKTPTTRMANAALLRQSLIEANNYINQASRERNLKLEALVPVITGDLPLRVHAHRADDIMTAVRIAEEFNIKIVIEHATEGYKVADILAAKNIPVIIGPVISTRSKVELLGIAMENAAKLYQAGVKFAIMTDHPEVPVQYLPLSAALTSRGGLPEEEVLKAITLYPAEILGLEEHIGTIEVGKDADIVILNRSFFDVRCRVEQVLINGDIIFS